MDPWAPVNISYEDYVAMCGCPPVIGIEGMLAHYNLTMSQWTLIAGYWNGVIASSPQYAQHGMRVEQEAGRIRAGGAPRPVAASAAAAHGPSTSAPSMNAVSGAMPGAVPPPAYPQPAYPQQAYPQQAYPQHGYPQQQGYPQQGYPQQPGYNQQAVAFGNSVGNAFSAFGDALGSVVNSVVGSLSPGQAVMVQWSDGKRYPASVVVAQSGQVQVAFPDGRREWVPQQYVVLR